MPPRAVKIGWIVAQVLVWVLLFGAFVNIVPLFGARPIAEASPQIVNGLPAGCPAFTVNHGAYFCAWDGPNEQIRWLFWVCAAVLAAGTAVVIGRRREKIALPKAKPAGTLHAHLFENPGAGVKRGLFWSLTCPGKHAGGTLSCEWLQWPLENWPQLDGVRYDAAEELGLVECSVYDGENHPVKLTDLALRTIAGSTRLAASLHGVNGAGLPFSVACELEFEGILVVPDKLFPKPGTPQEAIDALASFIDLPHFEAPEWAGFRYVFAPRTPPALRRG